MRDMKDDYPFHRGYQEVLGQRDGNRALRREIAADVPARAGPWDYAMIALGTAAVLIHKIGWSGGLAAAGFALGIGFKTLTGS